VEQYEDALTSLEDYYKRKHRHHVHIVPKWLLAATYAQLGRQKEAQEVLSKFMENRVYYKPYNVDKALKDNYYAFKNQEDKDRLGQGLQKAGLPMK
jgi:lipopolysaccharide biosynthesis regulator YciM